MHSPFPQHHITLASDSVVVEGTVGFRLASLYLCCAFGIKCQARNVLVSDISFPSQMSPKITLVLSEYVQLAVWFVPNYQLVSREWLAIICCGGGCCIVILSSVIMTPSVARREPYQLVTPHPAPHRRTCVWYECYLVSVGSATGAEDRPNTQNINCSCTTCIVCFDSSFLGQSICLYVLWPINEIMPLKESLSVLLLSCWQRRMCLAANRLKSSGNSVYHLL
jgi:hypothetical protein